TLALHVHAAAEMRAFGDGDSRRNDIAVDRAIVANVDFVARGDVAGHLAEHDHGLREHLRLDAAVGTDRQNVLAKLDRPLDVPFDGQIFTAVQLALDHDRFADVHDVFL